MAGIDLATLKQAGGSVLAQNRAGKAAHVTPVFLGRVARFGDGPRFVLLAANDKRGWQSRLVIRSDAIADAHRQRSHRIPARPEQAGRRQHTSEAEHIDQTSTSRLFRPKESMRPAIVRRRTHDYAKINISIGRWSFCSAAHKPNLMNRVRLCGPLLNVRSPCVRQIRSCRVEKPSAYRR